MEPCPGAAHSGAEPGSGGSAAACARNLPGGTAMMKQTTRYLLPRITLALALACAVCDTAFAQAAAHAAEPGSRSVESEARIATLEARVAELEALVHELLHDHGPAIDADAVEDKAEKAAEARTTEILEAHHEEEDEMARRHSYKFGGYVKADVLFSTFGDGSVAPDNAGRDFYLPSSIPVGMDGDSYLDFHAKESRVNFASSHILEDDVRLGTFVEIDFLMSDTGDERISNSFQPRLRHAFLTYNDWLFGQTWMTFFNVAALPESLDFIGPSESTIFGRQVQVRYSRGPWQFSLENPETTLTPYGGGDRIVADDSHVPDFVARYNLDGERSDITVAALLRELRYEDPASGLEDATGGFAISVSGVVKVGPRDEFRWMASAGRGLGRYIALNTSNGAVLDAAGHLHAIDSAGVFGSYRHFWSERWRSNLTLGYLSVDNDIALTGPGVTRKAGSVHLNLIYSPQPRLDLGVEFLRADRELESGADGDLTRLQFSAKYAY
jgi:hypothetical protein